VATADPGTSKSRRRRVYLDSSAYLCLLLGEKGWERVSDATAGAERVSSVLLVLETRRTLTRLAREGIVTAAQFQACVERLDVDVDAFVLRDLTLDLCASNVFPAVATPRSLDLAHLRTALWFHAAAPLDLFVTLDGSQQQAAKQLGLPA
jgi:uncharacterized protein with PIN domain